MNVPESHAKEHSWFLFQNSPSQFSVATVQLFTAPSGSFSFDIHVFYVVGYIYIYHYIIVPLHNQFCIL